MTPLSDDLRLDRRRKAIIAAARELFVEQGYERATLAEIVTRAGGSLATVYKLFGNKDQLLEAVVFESAGSGEAVIREAAAAGLAPVPTLHRIAKGLHEHFLDPVVIRRGRYMPPLRPGYSIEMHADTLERYQYPNGAVWLDINRS